MAIQQITRRRTLSRASVFVIVSMLSIPLSAQKEQSVFSKNNLAAWCIVPFDIKNRGPVERAEMLVRLGIKKLAYDWREKHIPTFGAELDALQEHHIKLQAFWLSSGLDPATDPKVQEVFSFLKRRKVKTQIWYLLNPPKGFDSLSQQQKVEAAAATVAYIVRRADSIGCTVGLYNHNHWYGEPENQLAILAQLKMKNLGLVYNFNHAQDQISTFPTFYPKILPHLIALNIAGLRKGSQEIYPVGKGDSEQEMIRIIHKSSYRGPIGIINEDTDPDAEVGLRMNLEGLQQILKQNGDLQASKTYGH